ncbi:MAG: PP2C family serine/threonine-protein phosphatase, partial [Mycobacteriales bacterium]
ALVTLGLRFAARSHTGLLRDGNEDSVYAGPRLLAVADGMGGHAAGEVASAVAISTLALLDREVGGDDPAELLREAVFGANTQLRAMVAADSELEGMGTTVTALLIDRTRLALVHIGDSRAYRLRANELVQVTRDHTLVQRLVDEGRITAEEAGVHPQRALVTRALDGREGLELDLEMHDLVPGDRYLLCSDGLSGVVSDATIRDALLLPDPPQAVDRLVELALRGGAPDNVTCVVADVVDTDSTQAVPMGDATVRVVAGSAADGPQAVSPRDGLANGSTAVAGEHAAGRAAKLRRGPAVIERAQHVRRRQRAFIAMTLVLGFVAAAVLGWQYLQSQYYVGAKDGQVAIFRGVEGSLAGIDLSQATDEARIPLDQLGEFEQRRVQAGISAASLADARDIVARLTSEAGATLPEVSPEGSPSPAVSPEGTPSPAASPADSSAAPLPPTDTPASSSPSAP